jgi:3D (Asp-Asp-Asp) domain-containing protein
MTIKTALLLALAALGAITLSLGAVAAVLGASSGDAACLGSGAASDQAGSGEWLATAYGPPWGGIQGQGITSTKLNLTTGRPAYEVAVDPRLIPLGSYVYIQPNPFGTRSAFYAGDTGGAIVGKHIDIYDWEGRSAQDSWGARKVTVTPAPAPASGNLLDGVAPIPSSSEGGPRCQLASLDGNTSLTPGQTAHVLSKGEASIPREAPAVVKRALEAGNLIHTLPYPDPDVHYGSLKSLWPAYDCSGATSFVLYAAGLLGQSEALDSTGLETYGDPGPGRWITVYANAAHAWIVVAGIALDTADYGGAPIPAGTGPRWRSEPLANLNDGTSYVARHPSGL